MSSSACTYADLNIYRCRVEDEHFSVVLPLVNQGFARLNVNIPDKSMFFSLLVDSQGC